MTERWYKRPWWWIFNPWGYAVRLERANDTYLGELQDLAIRMHHMETQANADRIDAAGSLMADSVGQSNRTNFP